MLGKIAAAEFTINRPETMFEAAVLALIAMTILFVIVRGLQSVTGTFEKRISFFFWTSLLVLAVLFLYTYRPWENDPMVQTDIEISDDGVQGVQADSDPGHRHDDGETTYDTGN